MNMENKIMVKNPRKKKINDFSVILLSQKIAAKEADEIIQGIKVAIETKIKKEQRRKKIKIIGVNTIVFAMVLNLAVGYIIGYIDEISNINLLGAYTLYSIPNFINAIIVILIMVVYYVISIIKKDN